MSRIKFKQPNNRLVTVDIYGESMSCYSDEEYEKDSTLRGIMKADIFVEVGSYGDVFHRSYSINDKTLYFDNKGIYTYKRQKDPFFYWKVRDVEKEYENWTKKPKGGYSVPLNEPRLITKNVF